MKKKDDEKQNMAGSGSISRRDFLRDAGIAASVPALGTIAVTASTAQAAQTSAAGRAAVCGSSDAITIEFSVNGDKYKKTVEPHWTLRQLLRDEIGLTSPKDWCGGQGACGSCTVIVNGRPVLSCMTLACECGGARIETSEGIARAKHPIIQAYIDHNAFQCGYCTPGFVCTSKALLDRNSNPTEADVRDALGGNLCRCATYQQHPPAVIQAAKNLRQA
jgi:aerobic-type carbon monoxide dehydrogenase small subunit (CoxS/CutS family)